MVHARDMMFMCTTVLLVCVFRYVRTLYTNRERRMYQVPGSRCIYRPRLLACPETC